LGTLAVFTVWLLWTELLWAWVCRYLSCMLIYTPLVYSQEWYGRVIR
jgi:hypothetical protein